MEDIFNKFPNLQILKLRIKQLWDCSAEEICFPRLDVLNELEELRLHISWDSFNEYIHGFPLSLKKILGSKSRGRHAEAISCKLLRRLPSLQKLCLEYTIIPGGKEWNKEELTF
ncbi:hypothetical protein T459_15124 [Capsicum annuum]|uniref:Uncharacterized protein n=1 Tax=Capsicum annuum TaxID=4072 RepID=A0A2G2ZJD0_CAPAN|nr:hypothetical protein T459_15124 [Capsicum annuum]